MSNCFVCHKGTLKGYKVSHSSIKTRRFFKPNLHNLTVRFQEGQLKKIKLCSKCYKKVKKDYWSGRILPFVPVSLINQKKAKKSLEVGNVKENGQEKGTKN